MKTIANIQLVLFIISIISVSSIDNNNNNTEIAFLEKSFLSSSSRGFGCINFCSNHGTCINGICICDEHYDYIDCSALIEAKVINIAVSEDPTPIPPPKPIPSYQCMNNCNYNGECIKGICVCDLNHTGIDCSIKKCNIKCLNGGQCHDDKCICRTGFAGPHCEESQ